MTGDIYVLVVLISSALLYGN